MSESPRPSKANAGKLLNTKLMPPRLHAAVIQREDLLARLDRSLAKKLTLVTASTGFGKTTLVGMWTASRKFPSAWVTLDENDNDPARFWTYVITAIRTFDPALGKAQLSALMTSQLLPFKSLLTPLINDLADLNEHYVLVLDDYQAIHSNEINQGVTFLLQHLPEALHLVLITRTHPDLPLAILRVRDEMIEIDAASLRFNQKETEEFLNQAFRSELPTGAVDKLLKQTEGWAAGLRLVTLSLQNKGGAADIEKAIQSFSGSDRYVADYLIKEVFESQPEPIQVFLMKTCFLRRLSGPLCEAVTDTTDGVAVLERLYRDNLFLVQLEDGRDRAWYRYSPLFAESIQYLARQRLDEAGIKDVFERASAWYESHGPDDEAIETALVVPIRRARREADQKIHRDPRTGRNAYPAPLARAHTAGNDPARPGDLPDLRPGDLVLIRPVCTGNGGAHRTAAGCGRADLAQRTEYCQGRPGAPPCAAWWPCGRMISKKHSNMYTGHWKSCPKTMSSGEG